VAEQATQAAQEQLANAPEQLSVAIASAQELIPDNYSVSLRNTHHHLIKFSHNSKLRVERHVRLLQDVRPGLGAGDRWLIDSTSQSRNN
jgi:hypothetical protein